VSYNYLTVYLPRLVFLMTWWKRESIFWYPSVIHSTKQSIEGDLILLSPFGHGFSFAERCNKTITSSVPLLFFSSSPSYVIWLIVTVIVNSIKRVQGRWRLSDITNKIHKIFQPRRTDGDTPSAIPIIFRLIWIQTTLFHFVVYQIKTSSLALE
jgi:hypothetical protein